MRSHVSKRWTSFFFFSISMRECFPLEQRLHFRWNIENKLFFFPPLLCTANNLHSTEYNLLFLLRNIEVLTGCRNRENIIDRGCTYKSSAGTFFFIRKSKETQLKRRQLLIFYRWVFFCHWKAAVLEGQVNSPVWPWLHDKTSTQRNPCGKVKRKWKQHMYSNFKTSWHFYSLLL